jgi:ParB-like chromosome segregation protein Spo0J
MANGQKETLAPGGQPATEKLQVSRLFPGDSPRLEGIDDDHAKVLAQVEGPLPPILVHRATMRVIDGMHRLQAARMRNLDHIDVRFFDGAEEDAFVLAVESNVSHGLPLSLSDRTAAATRILTTHSMWSDRAIGRKTGLAPGTIRRIRNRVDASEYPDGRLGRDGRLRPVDSADRRRKASDLIAAKPNASLREIAQEAHVSPATVRDVRWRLERGEDPVPSKYRKDQPAPRAPRRTRRQPTPADLTRVLQRLRQDPALRYNEVGRRMLTWLNAHVRGIDTWQEFATTMPSHCIEPVADLARGCANSWASFADELDAMPRAES